MISGVVADIRVIPPGGTVFIGEELVDISAAGIGPGSQIAWWAPGTSLDETPADIIMVSDPTRFSVMSSSFAGKEGIWYSTAGKSPVMKIKQPQINIRISDTVSDFDATGRWLPKGHIASFQIGTNLHEMRSRAGVSGAPVDIIITSPGGASYSSVSGPAGSFSLTGIPVLSSLHDTGPVWSTGGMSSGTYSIRAECTANSINNNNPAAVSSTVTVLIQDVNPLISGLIDQSGVATESVDPPLEKMAEETPPSSTVTPVAPKEDVLAATSTSDVVDIQPAQTPFVEQTSSLPSSQVSSPSPSLTEIPSSPPYPEPNQTRTTPFPGIFTIIALLYLIIRK